MNDGHRPDGSAGQGMRPTKASESGITANPADRHSAAVTHAPPDAAATVVGDAAHGSSPSRPSLISEPAPEGDASAEVAGKQGSAPASANLEPPVGRIANQAGSISGEPDIEPRLAGMRGVWSDRTLHERLVGGLLIRDETGQSAFRWNRIDPAGYRLAMGPEVYVSPAKASDKGSVRTLKDREAVLIPSGQFAFLCTEEIVRVPNDAFCFIALRSKRTKFRGLVNVSGFHADPGYDGRLVFAVFNAGPGDVHLRRGDQLFAIMFADLDRPARTPRPTGEGFDGISSDLIAPIAGELQSLAGLKESLDVVEDELDQRVRSMEREVAILRWAVALILGALVTLLVRTLLGR